MSAKRVDVLRFKLQQTISHSATISIVVLEHKHNKTVDKSLQVDSQMNGHVSDTAPHLHVLYECVTCCVYTDLNTTLFCIFPLAFDIITSYFQDYKLHVLVHSPLKLIQSVLTFM